MTLIWSPSGIAEADFRRKGMQRLHVSLRTRSKREAKDRHAAVEKLVKQKRLEMIAQLRTGDLTIERLTEMVEQHEVLAPIAAPVVAVESWGSVDINVARYLEWVQAHPNKSDGTRDAAIYQLSLFIKFEYEGIRTGHRMFGEITRGLIQAYQQAFVDAGRSPNVTTNCMKRVGALWRWAAREEAKDAIEEKRPARALYCPVDPDQITEAQP